MTAHPDDIRGVSAVRVLVVCTANICRSPLAAAVLDAILQAEASLDVLLEVSSAGVEAEPGATQCPESGELSPLGERVDQARLIEVGAVDSAALIVTLDRSQRAVVARMLPACRPRLFTLMQAALLAEHVGRGIEMGALPETAPPIPGHAADRVSWLVAEMDAERGVLAGMGDEALDIADVHAAGPHREGLMQVRDAAQTLGHWIARVTTTSLVGSRAADGAELL